GASKSAVALWRWRLGLFQRICGVGNGHGGAVDAPAVGYNTPNVYPWPSQYSMARGRAYVMRGVALMLSWNTTIEPLRVCLMTFCKHLSGRSPTSKSPLSTSHMMISYIFCSCLYCERRPRPYGGRNKLVCVSCWHRSAFCR